MIEPKDIPFDDWRWLKANRLDHLKPDHEGWVIVGIGTRARVIPLQPQGSP